MGSVNGLQKLYEIILRHNDQRTTSDLRRFVQNGLVIIKAVMRSREVKVTRDAWALLARDLILESVPHAVTKDAVLSP